MILREYLCDYCGPAGSASLHRLALAVASRPLSGLGMRPSLRSGSSPGPGPYTSVVRAQPRLLCGTWNLPGPGTEPVSLGLAGKFQPLHHQGSPVLMILYRLITVPGAGRVFFIL